jgi:hypothetical protein
MLQFDNEGNPDIDLREFAYEFQIFLLVMLGFVIFIEVLSIVMELFKACLKKKKKDGDPKGRQTKVHPVNMIFEEDLNQSSNRHLVQQQRNEFLKRQEKFNFEDDEAELVGRVKKKRLTRKKGKIKRARSRRRVQTKHLNSRTFRTMNDVNVQGLENEKSLIKRMRSRGLMGSNRHVTKIQLNMPKTSKSREPSKDNPKVSRFHSARYLKIRTKTNNKKLKDRL